MYPRVLSTDDDRSHKGGVAGGSTGKESRTQPAPRLGRATSTTGSTRRVTSKARGEELARRRDLVIRSRARKALRTLSRLHCSLMYVRDNYVVDAGTPSSVGNGTGTPPQSLHQLQQDRQKAGSVGSVKDGEGSQSARLLKTSSFFVPSTVPQPPTAYVVVGRGQEGSWSSLGHQCSLIALRLCHTVELTAKHTVECWTHY